MKCLYYSSRQTGCGYSNDNDKGNSCQRHDSHVVTTVRSHKPDNFILKQITTMQHRVLWIPRVWDAKVTGAAVPMAVLLIKTAQYIRSAQSDCWLAL